MKIQKEYIFLLCGVMTMDAAKNNNLQVLSTSFKNGQSIPVKYSYKDQNISPQISWSAGPEHTKSYVVICNDPDASTQQPWLHWFVFNIPTKIKKLSENLPKQKEISAHIEQGYNDYGLFGWGGPQPPLGIHSYYFYVYALDIKIADNQVQQFIKGRKTNQKVLMEFLKKHTLAQGQIMGRFKSK